MGLKGHHLAAPAGYEWIRGEVNASSCASQHLRAITQHLHCHFGVVCAVWGLKCIVSMTCTVLAGMYWHIFAQIHLGVLQLGWVQISGEAVLQLG
jgi:hypothetical protein